MWERFYCGSALDCTRALQAQRPKRGARKHTRAPAPAGARVYFPSMGGYEGMLLAILLLLVPPAAKGLHGERGGKAQAVVEKWR